MGLALLVVVRTGERLRRCVCGECVVTGLSRLTRLIRLLSCVMLSCVS